MRTYKPRRASSRWLEQAPEYVLDVADNPRFFDRYTVYIGGSLASHEVSELRHVEYLGMSFNPTSPQGFSMWGECPANCRDSHKRIRWLDLPENIRQHVIARCSHG